MTSINILFSILFSARIIYGSSMPFEDCGSVHILESIDIPSCSKYPCHVEIGSSINVTTTVLVSRATFDSTQLTQSAYFVVNSIIIEANVTPDLCSAIRGINGDGCRFRKGARLRYEAAVTVRNLPPIRLNEGNNFYAGDARVACQKIRAKLWWVIKRANGDIEICYRITVILR